MTNMAFPTTLTELRSLLDEHGIRIDKKLGQHFLIDRNMLCWIAEQGDLGPDDIVLEIGTGTGLLTHELAQRAGCVVTVETDKRMFELSGQLLADCDNIRRHHADILERRDRLNPEILSAVADEMGVVSRAALKVVSNIPYNIASPVIIDLLESGLPLERIVLTVQFEVARRLTAPPTTKDYGYLTVVAQYHSDITLLREVPREVFWPRPKVLSAVVRLMPSGEKFRLRDYGTFRAVTRAIFDYRRKNLLNSLALGKVGGMDKAELREAILECNLDPASRGEGLTVEQICALADALSE